MTTIETVAEIGPDRKLVITMPEGIPQGSHRVKLTVLESERTDERSGSERAEGGLEWKGNLLVFNGPVPSDLDIRRHIEQSREERSLSMMPGACE